MDELFMYYILNKKLNKLKSCVTLDGVLYKHVQNLQ